MSEAFYRPSRFGPAFGHEPDFHDIARRIVDVNWTPHSWEDALEATKAILVEEFGTLVEAVPEPAADTQDVTEGGEIG